MPEADGTSSVTDRSDTADLRQFEPEDLSRVLEFDYNIS
jgi:hypothetical protein